MCRRLEGHSSVTGQWKCGGLDLFFTYFCGFSIVTVHNGSYNPDHCCSSYKEACGIYTDHVFFFFFGSDFLKMPLIALLNIVSSVTR